MPPGRAYAIARGAIRKWMHGGGHVHPEVRAAAGRAEAGEVARQMRAHAHAEADAWEVSDCLIELAFNPLEPRGHHGEWSRLGQLPLSDQRRPAVRAGVPPEWQPVLDRLKRRGHSHASVVKMIKSLGRGLYQGLDVGVATRALDQAGQSSQVLEFFNPYHAPTGKFTTSSGAGQGQGKAADKRGDRQQRAHLVKQIASLRSQIAALQAQLPSTHRGARKTGAPAKKGAGALSSKQAAAAKRAATSGKSAARKASTSMSPATIRAKIAALRATLQADIAQLRHLK